jgi:AraC-like DNA-binding protein
MLFTIITEQEKNLPFYITGIGIQAHQEPVVRPEGFPYYQWTYCTKGAGIFRIGGKEYNIAQGSGFLFAPNIPHEYHATEENWETYWLTFYGSNLPSLFNLFNVGPWEIFIPEDIAAMLGLFYEIENDLLQDNLEKIIHTSAKLYQFLIYIKNSKRIGSDRPQKNKILKLKPIIAYMETNYEKYMTLDELAVLIDVTTHHMCKLFKSTFGISPFEYLIQLRLQAAKQLLIQSPHLKVKEVAELVSYNDTSYFCSIFKKQEKITPQEFRKLHGMLSQK